MVDYAEPIQDSRDNLEPYTTYVNHRLDDNQPNAYLDLRHVYIYLFYIESDSTHAQLTYV